MLLSVQGVPVAGREIRDRLRQIDPALDLLWHQRPDGGAHWAICHRWEKTDPRWAMVARGEMPLDGAFDILGNLPPDCPADQAYGYVVTTFVRGDKANVKKLLERVHAYNTGVKEAAWAQVMDPAMEHIETRGSRGVIPKVFLGNGKKTA